MLAADGIPVTALVAYQEAAAREMLLRPSCGLQWSLLAAIGRVESDHNQFDGAVLHPDGLATPPVIGPALNGHGTALILDTDHGVLDGDRLYDHAVGPMQFIPSTWARFGVDANGDGIKDPLNIFDAAAAAADYLCVAGGDLTTLAGQRRAVFAYNHTDSYVAEVLQLAQTYADGDVVLAPTSQPPAVEPPSGARSPVGPVLDLPPVDPGRPPALPPGPSSPPHPSPSHAPQTSPNSSSGTPGSASATPTSPDCSAADTGTDASDTSAPGGQQSCDPSPTEQSPTSSSAGEPTDTPTSPTTQPLPSDPAQPAPTS